MTLRRNDPDRTGPGWTPWLRRADQGTVGFLVLMGIVSLAAYWTVQTARHGRMLDIDRLEPRTAAFQVDIIYVQQSCF